MSTATCPYCDETIPAGAAFCSLCGQRVGESSPPPPPAPDRPEPAAQPDAPDPPAPDSQELLLEIDAAKRFFHNPNVRFQNLIDFRLTNRFPETVRKIHFKCEARSLFGDKGKETVDLPRLAPGEVFEISVPFFPDFVGQEAIGVTLRCRFGGRWYTLETRGDFLKIDILLHGAEAAAQPSIIVGDVYGGDINLAEVVQRKENIAKAIRAGGKAWHVVPLLPEDKGSHEWAPGATRQKLDRLKLVMVGPERVRKVFVFSGNMVCFGRGEKDKTGGVAQDLVLRKLPCRAPYRTPEDHVNKAANERIARGHGAFCWQDGYFHVTATESGAKSGLTLGDEPVEVGAKAKVSDHNRISLAGGAVDLIARVVRSGVQFRRLVNRTGAESDSFADMLESQAVSTPEPDAVLLTREAPMAREDTLHTHEYLFLKGEVSIGSGAGSALRVQEDGVALLHAVLGHMGGEFYLRPAPGDNPPRLTVNDKPIKTQQLCPLVAGLTIAMGSATIKVDRINYQDFKRLEA